jgi:hypothetical protein
MLFYYKGMLQMRGSQFLVPGFSMGRRNVLQLLFVEKSQKLQKNLTTTEAREKISTYVESL